MKRAIKPVILFLLGYCIYIAVEVTWRGISYPLMGVCGGLIMLLVDQINNKISWDVDLLVQGLIGGSLVTFFELVIGELALHTNLFPVMWDYSNTWCNFDGMICLPFFFAWVVLSIAAIFIADAYNYYVWHELPAPYYKICGKIVLQYK